MGRRISGLFALLLAMALAVFAVNNRQDVRLDLWPLPWSVDLPLYSLALLPLFLGLLLGLLLGAAGRIRHILYQGQQQRRIDSLRRQLDAS